jgi:hypothetical protein
VTKALLLFASCASVQAATNKQINMVTEISEHCFQEAQI